MYYTLQISKDKEMHIQEEVLNIASFAAKSKMELSEIALTLMMLSSCIIRLDETTKKLFRQKVRGKR